jgi:Transposase domain (DUF772)
MTRIGGTVWVDGRMTPMVALLLYAYARGTRSARKIERACQEDIAYRMIAMMEKPDHATIARFVERHELALGELFGSVLTPCAKAGLAEAAVVAIDGTKIAANANRHAVMDYEQIAREIIEEAKRTDAAEDELYGEKRGDELPPEIAPRAGRRGWFVTRSASLMRSAPERPGRFLGRGRSGSRRPSVAWRSSCGSSSARTRPVSVSASWVAIRWADGWAPDRSHTHRPILRRNGLTRPIWIPGFRR